MNIRNKKLNLSTRIKKLIPYLLILLILVGVGFFGAAKTLKAEGTTLGTCTYLDKSSTHGIEDDCHKDWGGVWVADPTTPTPTDPKVVGTCVELKQGQKTTTQKIRADCTGSWYQPGTTPPADNIPEAPKAVVAGGNAIENNINCEMNNLPGCFLYGFYLLFYTVPSFILTYVANFFNAMVAIGLSAKMLSGASFLSSGWTVVRDLSNLFFIIALLWIALQIILDIGGHGAQKMIGKVIIMALLINFSMFFTEVVIDSSNILASIFYNKIEVTTKKANGDPGMYIQVTNIPGEKDLSGSIANAFRPGYMMSQEFFDALKERSQVAPPTLGGIGGMAIAGLVPIFGTIYAGNTIMGYFIGSKEVPMPTMIAIILISGLIMCFAIYAFFIAGLSFIFRLIELWILIVFSPFAFMSFSVPFLEHVDYIGWDSWIKRLLSVSFMAPIFMFFMYFIFLLLDTNPFKDFARTSDQFKQRPMETVLMLLIPTLIILILLLYATKFAKKSSGVLGEKLTAGLKTVGGFALGAATGGLAVAGTASFGRMGAAAANSKGLKDYVAKGGFGSEIAMRSMEKLGSGSFDLRGVKVAGMSLGSATGMNLGEARKGGFKQRREEQVKKRQERAKDLEVGADEDSMKAVRKAEAELQEAKTDPSVQAQLLKLNEGTHDDEHGTGKAAAETALNNAINNNAGPAEIAALEKAFTDFKGLGTLERESAAADRELAAAERNLRDVINKNGANSWQADHARGAQALVEEKANKAKSDLTTRQIDIRGAGHAIHAAEVNLREKESIVTGINKERRINYAKAIQTDVEHAKQWILTMGQYSTDGAREAADLIRANAKIGGGGHVSGGGHGGRPAPTAHAPAPTHTPPPAPAPAGGGGAHTPAAH